jgi:hypothetical protein
MFPFFEDESCPVISGKPFVARRGEREFLESALKALKG